MMTDVLGKCIARHTKLCENTLNGEFIDKNKYSEKLSKITDIKLRKLSKGDFEKGIMKLMQLNFDQVKQESHGKIYYTDVNGVDIPAVYDMLCEIFLQKDYETRCKSFHETTEMYYNKVLSKYGITEDQFRMQVKLFLPFAKLERLCQCNPDDIQRAALEVEECILYPELTREECYVALKNLYKSTEASLIQFDVIPAQGLPGHLGNYFKVKLIADYDGASQTHHLFAKMVDAKNVGVSNLSRIPFKKERAFFETIIKDFEDLGLEKITDFCPKCYFVSNNMLLFDDLSMHGYESWDFYEPVSYRWLVTTIKILAKLHAPSIIFEEKLSKKLGKTVQIDTEYPDAVSDIFLNRADDKEEKIRGIYGRIYDLCADFNSTISQDTLKERIKRICTNIYESVYESDKIRNVLSHGDLWGANIMYKEDQTTGAASAYFVDFQTIRYCPPSLDLMFVIFVNADHRTRVEHQTDLIGIYYKELTQILSSYDIEIGKIFSIDELVESCNETKATIICRSLMYSRFFSIPKQQRKELLGNIGTAGKPSMKESGSKLKKVPNHEALLSRINGLVEDLVRICENMT